MKHNIFKCLLLGIALSVSFTSCREDAYVSDDTVLGDKGKTLIKFIEGPSKTLLFDAFTDIKPIAAFAMRRDANNLAGLTASTVQLTRAAVPAGYTFLPDNVYTLQPATAAKFTRTATGLTLKMAAGDFAADYDININGALLDPTAKYALAYTVSDAGGSEVTASTQKSITVVFTIKSEFDGIYTCVDGFVQRYTTAGVKESPSTLSGTMAGNNDVTMTTIDGTTVEITGLRWFGNASGVGGIDNLRATINPVTNQVTMKSLVNTTLANMPGKENKWDPATKTFTLNFDWNQTIANPRDITNLVLKYKSKRP